MKAKYNPIQAGVSYTIGNILIKGIPFLTLPIFTRLMSTSDFGIYNIYISYESIVGIVLGCGLSGTIRVAKVKLKSQFEEYISAIFLLQSLLDLAFGILGLLLFSIVKKESWMTPILLSVLFLNCLCTQIYNISSAKFAINGEVKKNLFFSFLLTGLNVGCSLLLCVFAFKNNRYLGRIYGTVLAGLAVSLLLFINQIRKTGLKKVNKVFWEFGIQMGLPLIFHSLSLTILAQSDKIMIESMVGISEAGIYSLAVTLSGIVSVIVTSVDNAWAPWFYAKLQSKSYKDIVTYNSYMVLIVSMGFLMITVISPEIIKLMSMKEYWNSIFVFPILILSVLYNFFYLIPVNFEYYHMNTRYIAFSTVVTAILNILLNIYFIGRWGYMAAAYSTALSKCVLFMMHWMRAWKIEKIELVDVSAILISGVITILGVFLTVFFADVWGIRYLILLMSVFATFIVFKKCGLNRLIGKKMMSKFHRKEIGGR